MSHLIGFSLNSREAKTFLVSKSKETPNQTVSCVGPVSHHTSVIYENKMYLFGGINGIDSNAQMYSLNLNDLNWELI